MNSYVDADKINLYHGLYNRDVILKCSAVFDEKLEVQILNISKDSCQIKLTVKKKSDEDQIIKAEFLNYLIGASYQEKAKEKCS